MNIHIITFGFRSTHQFIEDVDAADGPNVTWHLMLHSQRPDVVETCHKLAQRPNVLYYPFGQNRGMARSLNVGMTNAQDMGADVIMMMTDDIHAGPGDIQALAQAQLDNPDAAWVDGNCYVEAVARYEPSQLDCSTLNIKAIEAIGYFDRNFFPINFEDTDWKRRATLAGFTHITLSSTNFVHRVFNKEIATQAEKDERMQGFYRTREYYVRKWGGDQGQERFSVPFNDAKYTLKIAQADMENPYPEYAREDIEIPA